MPLQLLLPGCPDGAIRIGDALSILEKEGRITYFVGGDNYFSHRASDMSSRRFILASLVENGHVRACDLEKAPLCIAHRTLMNWLRQLRKDGPESFYTPSRRASARVMTPQMTAQCECLLGQNLSVSDVARRADIQESTLRKALGRGAQAA